MVICSSLLIQVLVQLCYGNHILKLCHHVQWLPLSWLFLEKNIGTSYATQWIREQIVYTTVMHLNLYCSAVDLNLRILKLERPIGLPHEGGWRGRRIKTGKKAMKRELLQRQAKCYLAILVGSLAVHMECKISLSCDPPLFVVNSNHCLMSLQPSIIGNEKIWTHNLLKEESIV